MATRASVAPAGKVTEVFVDAAEREGAFRLLENRAAEPAEVIFAAARAGFTRVIDEPFVFIPLDQTALSLPAVPKDSEMGAVGNRWSADLGLHVMHGIIVTAEGVTAGSGGQTYWVRPPQEWRSRAKTFGAGKKLRRTIKATNRPIAEKETVHWGTAIELARDAAKAAGYKGKLWFQLDAGADFAHLLASMTILDSYVTVRTRNERKLLEKEGLLADEVIESPPLGTYELDVPETNNRPGRRATLEVRYVPMVLRLRPRGEGGTIPAPLFAVHTREISKVPRGGKPLDWLLLTNMPGATRDDALTVINGYATRWRIEEVHKTWKSVTQIEESALESLHAFSLWAAVLFSVAIRIERLKLFARTQPTAPATIELGHDELRLLCRIRKSAVAPSEIEIAVAVRWIADLGGYMNPHQGPPGSITIARGLRHLRLSSVAIQEAEK